MLVATLYIVHGCQLDTPAGSKSFEKQIRIGSSNKLALRLPRKAGVRIDPLGDTDQLRKLCDISKRGGRVYDFVR